MRCSRDIECRRHSCSGYRIRLLVLACVLCLCPAVQAAEIAIRHASTKLPDDGYALDARIEFSFDDDIRNELVTNDSTGQAGSVYLAVLDPDAGTVTDAYELFPGFIDQVEIIDAGETGQVVVRLAPETSRLEKPQSMKMTDAHQQYLFPGDLGCEFAARMDEPIVWGRKPVVVRSSPALPPGYGGYNLGGYGEYIP